MATGRLRFMGVSSHKCMAIFVQTLVGFTLRRTEEGNRKQIYRDWLKVSFCGKEYEGKA